MHDVRPALISRACLFVAAALLGGLGCDPEPNPDPLESPAAGGKADDLDEVELVLDLHRENRCSRDAAAYAAVEGPTPDVSDKIVVTSVRVTQARAADDDDRLALNTPLQVVWSIRNDTDYPLWDAAGVEAFRASIEEHGIPAEILDSEREGFGVLADALSGNTTEFAEARFVVPGGAYFDAFRDDTAVNWTFASSSDATVAELFDGASQIEGEIRGHYDGEYSSEHWVGPGETGELVVELTPLHHSSPDPAAGELYFPNMFLLGGTLVTTSSDAASPAPLMFGKTTQLVDIFCDRAGRSFAVHGGTVLQLRGDSSYVDRPG